MDIAIVVIVLVVVFAAAASVFLLQPIFYLTEYLFFTRYPTFFGLVLLLLPILGPKYLPAMLSNVFVVDAWGAIGIGFAGTLYSWAVVYTFSLVWITIPNRCKLPWRRGTEGGLGWKGEHEKYEEWLAGRKNETIRWPRSFAALLLLIPLFGAVCLLAYAHWQNNAAGFVGGVVLALVVREVATRLMNLSFLKPLWEFIASFIKGLTWPLHIIIWVFWIVVNWLRARFGLVPKSNSWDEFTPDVKDGTRIAVVHARARWFFGFSFTVVAVLGVTYWPYFSFSAFLPSLVILLAVLMLLTWIFGRIGFIFDRDRVPVTVVFLLVVGVAQFFIPNTHVYRVTAWPEESQRFTASQAVAARLRKQQEDPKTAGRPFVSVACSGGGIRASLWTAFVLEKLQADVDGFEDQVGLMSSVSGGSVGSMYYYDREVCKSAAITTASDAAGASSLSALVWGTAYLDIPRFAVGDIVFGEFDRGWAQEVAWENRLPKSHRLSWLAKEVRTGNYPLHVYNASLQESGERFLLSPADIEPPRTRDTEQLPKLASDVQASSPKQEGSAPRPPARDSVGDLGSDMRLVTAARLSATFPYATPQSKANDPGEPNWPGYHAADGGYYDNSGLLTAIEVLDRYLEDASPPVKENVDPPSSEPTAPENTDEKEPTPTRLDEEFPMPKRIALIEIRADAGDFAESPKASAGGLSSELAGPLLTAFNVVFTSQSARNRQEIRWLGRLWQNRDGVELKHFVFYLSGGPLSWHLSEFEKEQIKGHWPNTPPPRQEKADGKAARVKAQVHNQIQLEALQAFMKPSSTNPK